MTAVLDLALDIAAHGFPVFPCGANKRPAIAKKDGGNGFHDAVTDPDAVRALFGRAPHAKMVGVPTGEATGFDVLDVDYRNDGGAWEAENLHRLSETRVHRTLHGGRHYVFRHAAGVFNTAGKLAPGIDVRGTGGYIIMPPSGGYAVDSDAEVGPWPDWLLDLVLKAKVATPPKATTPATKLTDTRLEGLRRHLLDRVASAPDGRKHEVLRNAALSMGGIMAQAGISEAAGIDMLVGALPASVQDWDGARKTAAWGLAHGRDRPLDLPDREDRTRPRFNGTGYNGTGNGHLPAGIEALKAPTETPPGEGEGIAYDEAAWKMSPEEVEEQAAAKRITITPLGFSEGAFFYLVRGVTARVVALTPDQHTHKALMAMASIANHWSKTRFFSEKTEHISWDDAVDYLLDCGQQVGWFNPDRLRGRGAWIDAWRVVLNLGDRLLVNGEVTKLPVDGSRYIYPGGLRLAIGIEHATPLNTADANQLVELCSGPRWEKPISGILLAGWIVCALVCGALRWRPHIWVTGASGSGKSWVMEQVILPLLGPMALAALSKTTEAGLRQTLGLDALAVVFDEFEQDEKHMSDRVQGVLDLMRQASSESSARIIKGTTSHLARSFRIRSSFCLSSINISMDQTADESRITVLALKPPVAGSGTNLEDFDALQAKRDAIVTPDYATNLLARVVELLPNIIANSETFSRAVTRLFGTRRAGDQLGALLAGAYALHSKGLITQDDADRFIASKDWGEITEGTSEPDEVRLLSHLMTHRIRITRPDKNPLEQPIGRLISAAFATYESGDDPAFDPAFALTELRNNYGILCDRSQPQWGIWVSTSHPQLKLILKGTPWQHAWSRALARLPGAKPSGGATPKHRFGMVQTKATWLPLTLLTDPDG